MQGDAGIRPPAVAGSFYPGDRQSLNRELVRCLGATARPASHDPKTGEPLRQPKVLVVPHAGYIYSGATAGRAYALLAAWAGTIRRVVLAGPVHRVAVSGLAVPSVRSFATPLGEVPLDRAAIDGLTGLSQVVVFDAAHAMEHSLEVQLPFLQTVLDRFSLVPLAVGDAGATEVADVLARLWGGPETLIVISTDLSHFHPYEEARRIDAATVRHILALDLLRSAELACGAHPLNGMLHLARHHGMRIECLDWCNSGDTAGDRSRVVGYASFALYEPDA